MKKISILGCIAAALLSLAGCDEPETDFSGTNYIYLESEGGKTSLFGETDSPIKLNVKLTAALKEDLTLDFIIDDLQNALEVTGNPVVIKAGSKISSFTIAVADVEGLSSQTDYTVKLSDAAELPEKVVLESTFSFSVFKVDVPELTEAQNEMIAAYKASTGIDLSKYLGVVKVETEISALAFDTEAPFDEKFEGLTVITLSEASTEDTPVLKMLTNPMGVQDYMSSMLDTLTFGNYYWFPEDFVPEPDVDDPYAEKKKLFETISWNANSKEYFSMSLDNIVFNADKSIEFVHEYYQPYYEDYVSVVPFAFEFSAYEREKAAIEAGELEDNSFSDLCTANPEFRFNYTGILEDEWEGENNLYVEPSAVITEDGKLVFKFCFDYSDYAVDYTKVVATYTPNN